MPIISSIGQATIIAPLQHQISPQIADSPTGTATPSACYAGKANLNVETFPMPEMTSYPSGSPSWADLLCHDGQAAKDFYTGLFGWTYDDHPVDENMVYTMFSHNGIPTCASAGKTMAGPGQ